MRITIGSGSNKQTVVVPQGELYRKQDHTAKTRFVRQFCQIAGIPR